jgi:predicted DNA helicase
MTGDHFQLPPTVLAPQRGPESLTRTLFERLIETVADEAKIRLGTQYRMNKKIMDFSSKEFYEGELKAHTSVENRTLADLPGVGLTGDLNEPVIFIDTSGLGFVEKTENGTQSRLNPEEANLVIKEFERLKKAGVPETDIAIISPYSAQVKLLSSLLQKDEWDSEYGIGPEIDSVDAFQGREKEVVIVSLVRANLKGEIGFLNDTRRMNVAMTRARRKLIVIGDGATISVLPFFNDFMKYVESINGYRSAWEYLA